MVPPELLERVLHQVDRHVRESKGYEVESWINPLSPVDSIAAFAMARRLSEGRLFDVCVSVAPEGHVYGYFFQQFDAEILSVHVDYPPRRCVALDDLKQIRGRRVLIIEDDVASGVTLGMVVRTLRRMRPASLDLYLGRPKSGQVLDHVDPDIVEVYLAEDHLDPQRRQEEEEAFVQHFQHLPTT